MSRVSRAKREQVRLRAGQRCEYCRKPESLSEYPHHVEHIVSLKLLGSSELDNLAWACFKCNVAKGTNVAAYDFQTRELTPLFNPRTQNWDDHFELDGVRLVGKTAVGRVTIIVLGMNDPEQLEVRTHMLSSNL
jgi:hypothetical protein